jgi:hypothetical protein
MELVRKASIVFVFFASLVVFGLWAQDTGAFNRYGADNASGSCGDPFCHGEFDGPTSTKGSIFPGGDKHAMHKDNSAMNTECNLCHTQGDGRDPFIGSSDGTGINPGLGCTGCHDSAGLQEHHYNSGQTFCYDCHTRVAVGAESDVPVYYGTVDSNVTDPCNSVASADTGENWTDDSMTMVYEGIDNDGDGLYDGNDPDCAAGGGPPPMANGVDGTALTASRGAGAEEVDVTFDNLTCSDDHAVILYGSFGDFTGYQGAVATGCNASGGPIATFTQSGSFWFVAQWVSPTDVAGSPGDGTAGPRTWSATGLCGVSSDDASDPVCD